MVYGFLWYGRGVVPVSEWAMCEAAIVGNTSQQTGRLRAWWSEHLQSRQWDDLGGLLRFRRAADAGPP
jgi:hypothetical protein